MNILHPGLPPTAFPPVETATPEGLLAVGGDLSPERLLAAYRLGIFPWFNPGQPILWWSPDPRVALYPEKLHVSRSLRKALRSGRYEVRFDTDFRAVMLACAAPRRQHPGGGTWITEDMIEAYCRLHDLGFAHSIETWQGDLLTGGLYGVALGGVFFGESMFARQPDASKIAMVALVSRLQAWGFALIDCQLPSDHLTRLGAECFPRPVFLEMLASALARPGNPGCWQDRIDTRTLTERTPAA